MFLDVLELAVAVEERSKLFFNKRGLHDTRHERKTSVLSLVAAVMWAELDI
jgi:hypothetical protein